MEISTQAVVFIDLKDSSHDWFVRPDRMHQVVATFLDLGELLLFETYPPQHALFGGDSWLACFSTIREALLFADGFLVGWSSRRLEWREDFESGLRIGVHSGEVRFVGKGIPIGDTVNMAKRVQENADIDVIFLSEHAYGQLRDKDAVRVHGEMKSLPIKGRTTPDGRAIQWQLIPVRIRNRDRVS